jgi:hypothetical protein
LTFTLAALLALSSCAINPPSYIDGGATAAPTPTVFPESSVTPAPVYTGGAVIDDLTITDEPTLEPQTTPADEATPEPPKASEPASQNVVIPIDWDSDVNNIELYYPGMSSMMGFVDAPISTIFENAMEAILASVSLKFPAADISIYRYSQHVDKADMIIPRETLLTIIGNPSFFRDEPMTKQPDRVKVDGSQLAILNEKMNEPIESFYELIESAEPKVVSASSGTVVAVDSVEPGSLSVIVTDLHELRIDDGRLTAALSQNILNRNSTIGVLAVMSEFSGYVPDVGANRTSFVWGSPPTGTLDYTLDFTDYKVGISVDPQTRRVLPRPFYIIVIGGQNAVSDVISILSDRLSREFSSNRIFRIETALYGSNYVSEDYALSMKYVTGQGVTAMPDASAASGVSRVELKAGNQDRFLQWEIDYNAHASDPRLGGFTANDFLFEARGANESESRPLQGMSWAVDEAVPGSIKISLRLDLNRAALSSGEYEISISGALTAPNTMPGMDWLGDYGWDPEGAQMLSIERDELPFSGDKTLNLSRLLNALGQAHVARISRAPLGTVSFKLVVF